MRTDRILPWLFFFPIMIGYYVLPKAFWGPDIYGQLFFLGIIAWIFFMLMSFWSGMMGLIRKDYFDRYKGYPELISGMNLWMIVICAYQLSGSPVVVLPVGAHLFIFALHFFQTSIFTNQNRTL